ncbi:methyl-accepting chemotaxis protein [uncultured Sphingomonas sp.]|uniref:methyl-accepting chemotaxis protein n=1 Tax=uncultured Sphingomonas sp. TaxID=158754 RepID=UPI0025D228DE|nr:methyl-accepting chemotaxis protein [uncultured Sphingomonas sp.]
MLHWFYANAPVRRKFDVLTGLYTILVAVPVVTTWLATAGFAAPSTLVAIAVGALACVVGVALASKKAVCDPYVTTVVRMEGLARDEFDTPIRFADHRDCVGRMATAMETFRANGQTLKITKEAIVSSLGAGLSKLASGDLTYRISESFPAEFERLRTDFNGAMDAVSEVMSAVSNATSGISNGASDIRQASDDLSQRTEQQAASLEETAAAMDEITGTVRETAAGATRTNAVVAEAREEAEQSGDVVRRAVDAMSGIERASSEISEIISVIDGIAFQTNLLALNAGVEAARAGDAGRGFAVVASEVRALAQRSADAAKDVKAKIIASSEQVEVGVELVSETGKALQRIIGRIGEISALVGTIASSASQQANGLQQVNTAVSEMDGVTQQNAAMVEQATAAARSLAEEAESLARQVGRFRLSDAPHVPAASQNTVHALQTRAAQAGRDIARTARKWVAVGGGGSAAAAAAEDDWSEF